MVIGLIAVAGSVTGVTLGVSAVGHGAPPATSASRVSIGANGAPAAPGYRGGQGGSSFGGVPDVGSVPAAVDPFVVDINTTLGLQQASAAGTGIVLTSSGEVLTNNHVIQGATSITATDVGNGHTYQATVVGYDASRDLAVIQLRGATGLPTARLGDSSTVAVGDDVVAIGNAQGLGGTPAAVAGTVTALNQDITASDDNGSNSEELTGLIQVAADIQPGDSGGPLADTTGHVIGIDTAGSTGSPVQATATTQGFAIPINQAMVVARQIEAGHASATVHIGDTAFLGVQVAADTGISTQTEGGAVIADVVPGSPAEQSGLTAGDVIVSIDGAAVTDPTALSTVLTGHHPGDQVSVGVTDQSGQSQTVTVRLASGPAA